MFWLEIPADLLNPVQYSHRECRPHVLAVEVGRSWVKMEFFARSLANMRCECQQYASEQQIQHALRWIHGMLDELGIRT